MQQHPEMIGIPERVAKRYLEMEAAWIDDTFARHWPRLFSWYARKVNNSLAKGNTQGPIGRAITFAFARMSGLTIHRNRNMQAVQRNGFRNRNAIITKSIIVTIKKRDKEIAKAEFQLYE